MRDFAPVFDGAGGCRAGNATRHEMLMIALHCMICGGRTCLTWSPLRPRRRRSFCALRRSGAASRVTRSSRRCSGFPARIAFSGRRGSRSVVAKDGAFRPNANRIAACARRAVTLSATSAPRARSWPNGKRRGLFGGRPCREFRHTGPQHVLPRVIRHACQTADPFEHLRCWRSASSCASSRGVTHENRPILRIVAWTCRVCSGQGRSVARETSRPAMEDCAAAIPNRSREDRFQDGGCASRHVAGFPWDCSGDAEASAGRDRRPAIYRVDFQGRLGPQQLPLGLWAPLASEACKRGMRSPSRWIGKTSIAAVFDVWTAGGWQGRPTCKLSKSPPLWY